MNLKRVIAIGLLATVGLVGCGQKDAVKSGDTGAGGGGKKKYTIGINQLMEHKALDDTRKGFEDGLKELGVDATIDYKNAQGEISNSASISEKFVGDKVDLIFAIATPAAQATARATTDIPVLFSAVTDPVGASLVKSMDKPGANITGTSDAADVKAQLELFKQLDPKIGTIGIIYSTSEANSDAQVKEVQKLAPEVGLKVETVGISSINDMSQSIQTLFGKIDALYIISDNTIASSIQLLSDELKAKKMISISAEESQVAGGALLTNGLKYYDLGKQTAKMAKAILVDGKKPSDMPVEVSSEKTVTVNEKTLEALGLDKNLPVFKNASFVK